MQTPPSPGDQPTVPSGQFTPPHQPDVPPYPRHDAPPATPYPHQPMPPVSPHHSPQPYPGAYGQPPYAPYGPYPPYPPYAPYGPPPQPPRSSNRGLWIGLSILGAVILLSCIGCAVGAGLFISSASRTFSSSFGPDLVAAELCTDETNSDYTAVYNLFSSNLQSQTSQDQFVAASQAREQSNGVVRNCTEQPATQSQDGSSRVEITLTLNDGQHDGFITLVLSGGIWQIDSYDDSLGLT